MALKSFVPLSYSDFLCLLQPLPVFFQLAVMFFFARALGTTRLFSTSAAAQFPKLKSHSGAKKRWRSIASGVFKRVRIAGIATEQIEWYQLGLLAQGRAGHKHLNVNKSAARKNALSQTAYSTPTQTATLKKLLPYGSP